MLAIKEAAGGNSKEPKATNGPFKVMLEGTANWKLNPANASPATTALLMKEVVQFPAA
jgi:hypothetical protein